MSISLSPSPFIFLTLFVYLSLRLPPFRVFLMLLFSLFVFLLSIIITIIIIIIIIGVMERNGVTVMWDFMVQCDRYIEHRKPDILIIDSLQRRGWIIDVAIPGDSRVTKKEEEKVNKYQDLRLEIVRLWKLKKVDIIPVVVGALGAVSRSIENWLEKLGVVVRVEHIQKTALLGTANIIRRTLQ